MLCISKKRFACDPGALCLLPASITLWQAHLLICTQGIITNYSHFDNTEPNTDFHGNASPYLISLGSSIQVILLLSVE